MRRLPLSTGRPDASSLRVVEGPAGRLLLIVPPPADEGTSARAPETPPERRPEDQLPRDGAEAYLEAYLAAHRERERDGAAELLLWRRVRYWASWQGCWRECDQLLQWRSTGEAVRGIALDAAGLSWEAQEQRLRAMFRSEAFRRDPAGLLGRLAAMHGVALIDAGRPLLLEPVIVPKPWGRELWYSGIEARGVSTMRVGAGRTSLFDALHLMPRALLGEAPPGEVLPGGTSSEEALFPPILLKQLDPFPQAGLGDLYLEVHRAKWEAYLVSALDASCWPAGEGILLAGTQGAQPEEPRIAELQAAEAYRRTLGAAIDAYAALRARLEPLEARALAERGWDAQKALPLEAYRAARAALPAALREEERGKRQVVQGLLGRVPLRVGDVAVLPPGVVHSLQHGVQVIEFQTPSYERSVAMASQRVLTQGHWDTAAALAQMRFEPYQRPQPELLEAAEGVVGERVVAFPQFEVQRWRLSDGATWVLDCGLLYGLLHVVCGAGSFALGAGSDRELVGLRAGQAWYLPAALGRLSFGAEGELLLLLALPKLSSGGAGEIELRRERNAR